MDLDLSILRTNLHGLLGLAIPLSTETTPVSLYEKATLVELSRNFKELLDSAPHEEILQRFITDNPILLNSFDATRIFPKAPILTKHKTDFAILTASRQLLLVELEKTTTRLIKTGGGTHSDLQHAFDQTRDWKHLIEEHRVAALECIGLRSNDVAGVVLAVVAGRDKPYEPEHLRRLKSGMAPHLRFYTYDDLAASLEALIEKFARV